MKILAALAAFAFVAALAFGVIALQGFVAMLLLGALHNSVHEAIPALGFWASVLIALALNFVGGFLRNAPRTK